MRDRLPKLNLVLGCSCIIQINQRFTVHFSVQYRKLASYFLNVKHLFIFKLKRPYLELFKFTAFFPKGSMGLAPDHCQLIEIFDSVR